MIRSSLILGCLIAVLGALPLPASAQLASLLEDEELVEDLPPPWKRLRIVEERLIKAHLAREPWVAYEQGHEAGLQGLGSFDPDSVSAWTVELRSSAADLEAIRQDELREERRFDHTWLSSWVRVQMILAYSRAPQRWNPVHYVDRAHRVLTGLEGATALSAKRRRWQVIKSLAQIPDLWETARRGLVAPSSEYSAEAVRRLLDLASYIENDLLEAHDGAGWDPEQLKAFEHLKTRALAESLRFRNWLSEAPLKAGGPTSVMGAESWRNVISELVGVEITIPALKSALLRDLSDLDRRLGKSRELVPTPEAELAQGAILNRVLKTSKQAAGMLIDNGLIDTGRLPAPADLRMHVETRSGLTSPSHLVQLRPAEPRGRRLIIETTGPAWAPPVRETRAALLSPPAQRIIALRYGIPGESLLRTRISQHSSRSQEHFTNRATIEGWGLYMADLLTRPDAENSRFAGDEALRTEFDRMLLLEVVRLLAAIELHAEEGTTAGAARSFRARSNFDEHSAIDETRMVMHDPLTGIGYLTYLELLRLEESFGLGPLTGPESPSFLELVLEQPSVRAQDIRELLTPTGER